MGKYFIFFALFFSVAGIACKKSTLKTALLEQYFETNILNKNFIVSLATDNGTDITANYSNEVFVLQETDLYHGPLQATKNGTIYTGTWSSNDDYSKLVITLPNSPSEFSFLSRAWRFTSKSLPTMKLAPWGSSEPIVLHMQRQ
jgi:hypothetical protein